MKLSKRFLICSSVLVLAVLGIFIGLKYMNNIKNSNNIKYKKLLADEIEELRSFYGIRDVSQVSSYINQDEKGFNNNSDVTVFSQIHKFETGIAEKTDTELRFVTKNEGTLYLGYIVFRDEKIYGIVYNTRTDKYSIKEYDEITREKGSYTDASNLLWSYTDVYAYNSNEDKLYLYTWTYTDYPHLGNDNINNFAEWVKGEYEGYEDIKNVNLMRRVEETSGITDKIQSFRQAISDNPMITYEYRYIFQKNKWKWGICSIFYANNEYYYIAYLPRDDWYEFRAYSDLYVKRDENGEILYILSNLEEDYKYEINDIFDQSSEDYLYVIPQNK